MVSVLNGVIARSDLADLVLLAWAMTASAAALALLRELNAANARFEDFIRELHRFNSQEE
ncbi:hypothetical protein KIH24_02880 [Rhizobiales bacterium TNE-4]|nr:hypothetical protein [Rhizobiales bacterium TNE-4]MBV1826566.1 hypothetical protein [Rhizobiales bacterium TNE-4]